jgi:hypothetical protein
VKDINFLSLNTNNGFSGPLRNDSMQVGGHSPYKNAPTAFLFTQVVRQAAPIPAPLTTMRQI